MLRAGRTFCASCFAVTTLPEEVPAACIMGSNLYCLREFAPPQQGLQHKQKGDIQILGVQALFCTRNARGGA